MESGTPHDPTQLAPATIAIATGRPLAAPGAPLNTPIHTVSSFHAGGPHSYARESQPSWESFEEVIGLLEGGTAVSFASGMGAIAACLDLFPLGATWVVPTHAYSGTLARLGELESTSMTEVRRVDITNPDAIAAALDGATALWLESPTNPMMEICDIEAAAKAAHAVGAMVFCDNTFATPMGQNPLALGVDVVVHSATKAIGGHSDLLLGVTVSQDPDLVDRIRGKRQLIGATPGALEAFLALRGVRTLALRTQRAAANAGIIAERLQDHQLVEQVRYPGLTSDPGHAVAMRQMKLFGSIVAVQVVGDAERTERFCAATQIWTHATSLGGIESTLERRARWAGEQPDVPANLVRLSVGCEEIEDLWTDLKSALEATA